MASLLQLLPFICLHLLILIASTSSNQTPKPHVVYMGSSSKPENGDAEDTELTHLQLLSTIIPSEESKRISLIHHYKHAFKGFAAMLTEKEALALSDPDYNRAGQSSDHKQIQCLRLLEISEDERDWRYLLSDAILSGSHLWASVKEIREGILLPPSKQTWSVLMIRYSNHLLFGRCPSYPLTFEELVIAERLMKGGIQVPSANEVLAQKKAKRRRNSKGTTSKQKEQTTPPVIVSGLPSQGVGSSQPMPEDPDIVNLNFPANASIYSDAPNMVGGIAAWLLPEDRSRFDSLGEGATADWVASRAMQVMSGTLYLRDLVHTQARKNQDLQATNAALRKQIVQTTEREKELVAKSRADLVKYEKVMSEHRACASQIQCLTDQLQTMAMNASLKTRAELMVEFKAGKSSEWDPDEAIDIWRETEAEMAEEDDGSSHVEPAQDG